MGTSRSVDEAEEAGGEELQVLLVEDETADARFTLDALETEDRDVDVEATPYGERALELVDTRSFDAVLLDYGLPRMDGTAFLEELRRRDHQLPVVVLTGRGSSAIEAEVREAGADAYLEKDASDDERIREALTAALEDDDGLSSP